MSFPITNRRTVTFNRAGGLLAVVGACCLLAVLALAPRAHAGLKLVPGTFANEGYQADGATIDSQAAGHPASVITNIEIDPGPDGIVSGYLRDTEVRLPPGFTGYPQDTPKCSRAAFDFMVSEPASGRCPAASQVGVARLSEKLSGGFSITREFAIYNLEPLPGTVAQLGFKAIEPVVYITVRLDPATHGLIAESTETAQGLERLTDIEIDLWGVPAAPSHDAKRGCGSVSSGGLPCPVNVPPKPFLSNPTTCGVPSTTHFSTNSIAEPNAYVHDSYTSPEPIHGCDRLVFKPTFEASPTSRASESSSGFSVHLDLPQNDDPDALSTPPLRTAKVVLPEGMSINAASADGLGSCSDAQLGLKTDSPNLCPDNAKLGTVRVVSAALEEPMDGSVYLRTQNSNDPESGEMFRMAMVLEQPERGLLVKLPGQIKVNKNSGRIETLFADNPQLPVSSIDLNLKSGPRAALQTPRACGTYATDYELTSWGGQVVKGQSKFSVDQNCSTGGFKPGFEAGSVNPSAGSFSSFALRVTRNDGEQNISKIETTLPQGLLAKLGGVPLCGDAQAASGSCPASSQVGTTTVGAGAGSNPLYVPQPGKAPTAVYLAGPYKGAPYSLVVKVPAQAGPFDLGTVSVRNKIEIDPVTAQASVSSDPLPQIIQGIPIAYRDVRVNVDRKEFTINPTSCDPMAVKGTIGSAQGKNANVSSRFQAANCERLAFKPKLALKLSGQTHRSAYPKLTATLTMPNGGANIERAAVTLPKTEILAQEHIRTICTRVQYAADNCPKASIYGYARAWTPLLDKPLQGPVYLRSSNNPLPDLVASLDGQIEIDLAGRIDSVDARIRNTFDLVPDAPVSKFVLTMQGGKKGLLVNNTELCKAKPRADVKFDGQNGKTADSSPLVKVQCGKKAARKGKSGGGKK